MNLKIGRDRLVNPMFWASLHSVRIILPSSIFCDGYGPLSYVVCVCVLLRINGQNFIFVGHVIRDVSIRVTRVLSVRIILLFFILC